MGSKISFPRVDGKPTDGYLAKAAKANAPGVVVIQEWWGLQGNIIAICDRFALAGFDALAPDLYAGTVVPYHDRAAAEREMKSLNFKDAAENIVRGAVLYLKASSPKVGMTGFCMGGAVTLLSAVAVPELSCAAPFYGMPAASLFDPAQIKIPVQGHYSLKDDHPTPEEAKAMAKKMQKKPEIFFYEASHAFMNEQRSVHDRAASELAWGRLMKFMKKHLA